MISFQQAKADKWFSKEPGIVAFDDRFQFYQKIKEEVAKMAVQKDQEFIQLHMNSLQHSVQQHIVQWTDIYGKLLRDSAKTSLYSLKDDIEVRNLQNYLVFVVLLHSAFFRRTKKV